MSEHIFYTLEKSKTPSLCERLTAYSRSGCYPFHMPGHKRAGLELPNPYSIDITEIPGFDNLHHAKGVLKEAQELAARSYGAKETFFLVNGSTSGVLSAISAALPKGGTLLMSRNSHKSAYHAAYLREAETIYLLPPVTEFGVLGSVPPAHVAQALEEFPQTSAVFITSPTYDGVVSDVAAIAEIAHAHDVPLIVDEAHGAHFAFSDKFPASALICGADLVIHSLHKTLPCLTQSALLHVNSDRVDVDLLQRFLRIYQTSSPSYLLMASIDQCLRFMAAEGEERMAEFSSLLDQFYQNAATLRYFRVLSQADPETCYARDRSKILISVGDTGLSGKELHDVLMQKYHLQMEMAAGHYVTALSSVMDTAEGFRRLYSALENIERNIVTTHSAKKRPALTAEDIYQTPKPRMSIFRALEQPSETLPLKSSIGHICQDYISLYPPGIPLAAPGEVLTGSLLSAISRCHAAGLPPEGMEDLANCRVRVVKE